MAEMYPAPHLVRPSDRLKARFYPESRLSGFSHVDGTVALYSQVAALLRPDDVVLEFGAGRGSNISTDPSAYRGWLQKLHGRCALVHGCDVDPIVLENPFLDVAKVITPDAPLPYANDMFDIIIVSCVFEHIRDAAFVAGELLRVLKPGGTICATTPNSYGYVALVSRLVGSSRHVRLLRNIQPDRAAVDIFPTYYRMNTRKDLIRLFGGQAEVTIFGNSAEPAYHFNNPIIYGVFKLLHALLPPSLSTVLYVFIRKRGAVPSDGQI